MTVEIEESFLREAYDAACSQWKAKLKNRFPKFNFRETAKQAVEKFGAEVYNYSVEVREDDENEYIIVPLPVCNRGWTLAAFDWINKFIEAYPNSYVDHGLVMSHRCGNGTLVIKFKG